VGAAGVGSRRSRRFAACSSIGRADVALRATRVLYAAGNAHSTRPLRLLGQLGDVRWFVGDTIDG
jgi:hypothetical protein